MTSSPHRRRGLPHPRAARHLGQLAAGAPPRQGAEAGEGRRRAATRGSPASAATPTRSGSPRRPGMPFDEFRWFGVTYEEARAGCYNGAARLADMDIDGVWAEVLFPPQRTMSHFLGDDDDDFVLAGVEAYNNFLFEEFCAPDPTRLIGLAQIPSLGIDVAVDGAAQGEGARREGRAHLQLAVGQQRAVARRRPVLGRGGRRGHAGVGAHQHHQPRAARRGPEGRGQGRQPALRHDERGDPRQGDRRHEPRVLDGRRQHHRRCCSPASSTASRSSRCAGSRPASAGCRTSSSASTTGTGATAGGATCRSRSRRRTTGTATTRPRSSPTVPGSRCATRSASTT